MTDTGLYEQVTLRPRRRRRILIIGLVLLAVAAAAAWWFLRPQPESPDVAANALAAAWTQGKIQSAPFGADGPTDVAEQYAALVEGLGEDASATVTVAEVAPPPEDEPERTTATLDVAWDLGLEEPWTYQTTADLSLVELTWEVSWSPSLVHPRLEDGLRLATQRTRPARGEILAADGTPLVTNRPVVDVGVQPSRTEDVAALTATLEQVLEVDGAALAERIEAAGPDQFVPVITLREEDYLAVEDQIFDLPGTVFRRDTLPLAPTRDFARALLGRAGPVTAEMIEEQPERYVAGDIAGTSGLQARYDEQLFGTPGVQVLLTGDEPPDDPVLFEQAPVDGESITITLDERVQRAADDAVAGTGFPTALVALRVSDGQVLAAANSEEAGGFNLAFEGRVPPGSTFKIVTTAALMQRGLTVDETVSCPNETTVDGRTITNAEDQVLGDIPFRTAFFRSCNTAFVQLSQRLEDGDLADAAAQFGIGQPINVGVPASSGEVPVNESAVDLAAASIGQGRNVTSPLAMAGVVATVARGSYLAPSLVLDPEPEAVGGGEPAPLPAPIASDLQELTRLVVSEGTGTAVAGVPGGPVHGKTGTAEYGTETPPRTHAWFVGYQGDLAFAVLVAETPDAYGGEVAAPIAADFLTALNAG